MLSIGTVVANPWRRLVVTLCRDSLICRRRISFLGALDLLELRRSAVPVFRARVTPSLGC